ncbi:D-lactate dehydrogenase (cytochrome) [Terribacillus aidingensis]|uniref:D-lactate dehydrogenase (cytochrome) n=1 Tax=Terribacillus aidingensis TaxID=586416 RepID=A0A285P785_9BACI|nr:FAD-linked oxidase C-terminal domain-containing protein [Terribacillus aidingensis]SNZ17053.1 D-lactate dehydrogenase (cytochrome) [Terribacillus aidingensis]
MDIVTELSKVIHSGRISTAASVISQHNHDASYHPAADPDVVVFPENTKEVSGILSFANKHGIPVTPFGKGSSLEGHAIPYNGGISLDLGLMNQLKTIEETDGYVVAGAGLTQFQLNDALKKHGLFFSVDPGAEAALGGMAGTNASGSYTVKYGTMRDNILDMEVVLPNGEIIHTGSKALKSSSGLHLSGLFAGSEGVLGVITELTLRVHPIPEATVAVRAVFHDFEEAVTAVVRLRTAGLDLARIEFVDAASVAHVNQFAHTTYKEQPTIFFELNGETEHLRHQIDRMEQLLKPFEVAEFLAETDPAAQERLWDARHNLAYYYIQAAPTKQMLVTDVCLPISKLSDAILHARQTIEESGLEAGIVGHVGDGNFHIIAMVDFHNPAEVSAAKQLHAAVVDYTLVNEGTCTGEHGVGVGKKKYQKLEHGAAYELMRTIKRAVDPRGIMNPGKLVD